MANRVGLNELAPSLFSAVDQISRELTGFIPAVTHNMDAARAAVGEKIVMPITTEATISDIVPNVVPPDDGDNEVRAVELIITKAKRSPVRINGEQQKIANNAGGWENLRSKEFAQAMRKLVNAIEIDIAMQYIYASRAYGTAGVTPFNSTSKLADVAYARKILDDNGAPQSDRQLVINTTAAFNLGMLTQLTNVSEAGTDDFLRRGIISPLLQFDIRQSAGIQTHVGGTGTGYLVDLTSGYGVGDTTLHVDTGTAGATGIVAGDIISIAGDPSASSYVIGQGTALAEDDIILNPTGLRGAVANNAALTLAGNYQANMAFSRSAIHLATRAPAVPDTGDSAVDSMVITDDISGLSFEVREYRQYRQVQYEVGIAWGVACVHPAHCCILMG
jgi:hypothetical protein